MEVRNHDGKENYLKFFGNSSLYRKQYQSSFLSALNTVTEIHVADIDYLVINLDYCPSNEILAWASSVVEAHPNHNVIITTHNGLNPTGGRNDENINQGNGGTAMWEKFTSQHPNIVLAIYGHYDDEYLTAEKNVGVNGNVVTELLIDGQHTDTMYDGAGLVAFLYFSNGGKHVDFRYYSTLKNQYYRPENQFSFDLNVIPRAK